MGPMVLPSKNWVSGNNRTSRITNGTERIIFTSTELSRYTKRFCQNKCRSVTKIRKPSGRPPIIANSVEMLSIWKVSLNASVKSGNKSSTNHLHLCSTLTNMFHGDIHRRRVMRRGQLHHQNPQRTFADIFNFAVQNVHRHAKFNRHF